MMTDRESLLGAVAQRHAYSLEDAATDALTFILSRRASAREALSEFLGDDAGQPLAVAKVESWAATEHGAIPDVVCRDEQENAVAFIESKFWATLTDHQPVTYWRALSADQPSVLLFLAPHSRVESGSLWNELVDRLRKADVEVVDEDRTNGLVSAIARDGRRLMLTSWDELLGHIAEAARRDGDSQVCFEISQLQGLAAAAVKGEKTTPDEKLRQSFADAVERLKRSGWANTDGLTVGIGASYFARYFRLAGAPAGLRIDYEDEKQRPDRSLWLWFWNEENAELAVEDVARLLEQAGESELEWRGSEVLLPIVLPADADEHATVNALVAELERVGRLLDRYGPTYRIARDFRATDDRQPDERRHRPEGQISGGAAIKVVSWNIDKKDCPWRELVEMDADVALLQESGRVPEDVLDRVELSPHAPWLGHDPISGESHYDRWPRVVRLSDRVRVEWFRQIGPTWVLPKCPLDMAVSGIGTLDVARVIPVEGPDSFIAASMYGRWFKHHPSVDRADIYADASVHRIISDLSAFIADGNPGTHRVLAAGDLNVTYGYGHGSGPYWDGRYQNLFERMKTTGLEFLGPQQPNGRQAETLATGEPKDSKNVVTYHLRDKNPVTASNNQFDFAFASRGFHKSIEVRAMNEVDEWGSSDHCRLVIEIAE